MNTLPRTAMLALAVSTLTLTTAAYAGEVVWWTPNWGEARAKELVEKFQAANPGITIKMEVTVSDGLPARVLTALQSGAAPDIIEVQHGWVNGYAQNDLVIPLDDTIQDANDYTKAALDYVSWGGKLWAIPYRIETHAIIYNKGLWKAAGLDPEKVPQTWAELVDDAAKIAASGVSGFAITGGGEVGNTIFRSLPFIWMNGGGIVSDDVKTAIVNQPAAVEAVKFYTDFYKNGQSPASTLQNDGAANRKLFIAQQVAAYQSGQFDVPSILKEAPSTEIGVFAIPHPEGKNTAAILGGWSYVIPKDAKNPGDAKTFLQFLSTSENQAFFTDTFPARISSMDADRFKDPILSVFKSMLPYGRPVPIHKNWVQITQAYFDGIQRILTGDQDVQAAMDQANEEIQALLDQ
ncbi:MAG: ABC transporter substrate-binding protein [Devosia nanyangense]|uniref:ABC transporter substrate-binding protein n=1 Tax=Devosia nanyangense TaxID=1228055 RepID=A0A933NYT2_9HYPH|nr:ABC transporter substrate-binding protein [Devosia nanyangense]